MAILFMEGFDGYADSTELSEDARIGLSLPAAGNYSFVTGRNGSGQALSSNTGSVDFTCNFDKSSSTIWIQFAYKTGSFSRVSSEELVFLYSSTGTLQCSFYTTSAGYLAFYRGSSTLLATATSGALTTNVWHFIELKVNIHDSTGSVVAKVDGVEVMNSTGLDTKASSTTDDVSSILFNHEDDLSSVDSFFDDIVIGDDSGTDATDLLGDCSIELLTPDGAGNYAQFTPSTGSNYQNVDEAPSTDDDTTYNSSSTAGHKDTFTCSNLTATAGSVYAVQVTHVSRREAGGGRLIRGMIRTSSTDANGTGRYVPTTYGHRQDIFENDAGGSDWTISSVNAMEIGYNLET